MTGYSGIWPALVTPLTDGGAIDAEGAEGLIEALIGTGIGGLYVCGGTGEGVLLRPGQRREMAEVAIAAVGGRVPVMIHVGTTDTETAVELAQHASLAGADAVSAVPPFYYGYPFAAIKAHYRAIAEAASVPVYMYYIPDATGVKMTAEQIIDICALDGIAGLKYTSEDLGVLGRLLALRDPEELTVLSGPDPLFLATCALGVDGAIGTMYNFMPRLYIDIMGAVQAGDLAAARRLQHAAGDLIAVLRKYAVLPGVKALLNTMGFRVGACVPPMPRLDAEQTRLLRQDMEAAGLTGLLRRRAAYGPEGDPMRGRLA